MLLGTNQPGTGLGMQLWHSESDTMLGNFNTPHDCKTAARNHVDGWTCKGIEADRDTINAIRRVAGFGQYDQENEGDE